MRQVQAISQEAGIPRKASAFLQALWDDQEERAEGEGEFAAGSAKGSPCWMPLAALEIAPSQRCSSVWLFWFPLSQPVSPSCGLLQLNTRAFIGKRLVSASGKLEHGAPLRCCFYPSTAEMLCWWLELGFGQQGQAGVKAWPSRGRTGVHAGQEWGLYARIHLLSFRNSFPQDRYTNS